MTTLSTSPAHPVMTIGSLARAAGVNVETVRYYQRIGLLDEPMPQGSYRYYGEDHLRQLQFIRRAKEAGFMLEEIRELLQLDAVRDRQRIQAMANARLADINQRIRDMQALAERLRTLVERCQDERHQASCPIVETFRAESGHAESCHNEFD
jgi:MerR family mercuric resistance operon transcriptional regulator